MKALVYTEPGTLNYRDEPDPVCQSGDVLLKIDAVGICGSDLHAFLGHDERRPAPLILGHEASGTIVGGKNDGAKMLVNPLVPCGRCSACVSGRTNICPSRQIVSMAPRQGAFAQLLSIPEHNLIQVPGGMDMVKAALAEPIATGWHAVAKAAKAADRPLAECRALVLGGGAVGLSAALSLNAQGCRNILLAETNALRRATAKKEEFCTPFDPLDNNLAEPNSIDVVIDCVGANTTRKAAVGAVVPGGVIVHVGLMDADDGIDVRKLTLQEITFIGSYTYTMQDFKASVAAMHSGALGSLNWYEERPLSEGASAFADLLQGRSPSAKILLRPH